MIDFKKIFTFFFTGLSFRPQASFNLNDVITFISLSTNSGRRRKRSSHDDIEMYIKSLDEFLKVCK